MMDRRAFITIVSGSVLAAPLELGAQQSSNPVIGFLSFVSDPSRGPLVAAFRQGLNESGYIEGQNVGIEFRWAEGHADRLSALAADLVRRGVAVLVATGGAPPALAAKAATSTVPIVFTLGGDPVQLRLVASLGRPGGNTTGVTFLAGPLHTKRLQLLQEAVPNARVVAMLMNPENSTADSDVRSVQDAARSLGQQVRVLKAHTTAEIDAAFVALAQLKPGALFVASDAFFFVRREQIVALAARYRLPASFDVREFVAAGGLMSYGASLSEVYRQAGVYAGRILSGVRPAELPVIQPTKVELAINLRAVALVGLCSIPVV